MTTSVDISGMQAAQQDFQEALDQLNSAYGAMTEEQDTLSASWTGMAASAFGQALNAWLDDLYQIRQELVVMTESLSTHTGIYSDANEASQQVATAFQQQGNGGLAALDGLAGLDGLPGDHALRRAEGRVLVRHKTAEHEVLNKGENVRVRRGMAVREKLLPEEENVLVRGRAADDGLVPAEQGIPVTWQKAEGTVLPDETNIEPSQTEPAIPALHWRALESTPAIPTETDTEPRLFLRSERTPAEPLHRGDEISPGYTTPLEPGLVVPAIPAIPALPLEEGILPEPRQLLPREMLRDVPADSTGS